MSLASLLLGGAKDKTSKIDNELDSIFKSQPVPPPKAAPKQTDPRHDHIPKDDVPQEDHLKRKRKDSSVKKSPQSIAKRQKPDVPIPSKASKHRSEASKSHKKRDPLSKNDPDSSSDDEENDPALEEEYLSRTQKASVPEGSKTSSKAEEAVDTESSHSSDEDEDEDEDDDYNLDVPPPKHETQAVSRTRTKVKSKKVKYIPPDETPAQRDARTVFIGNVPADVVKARPAQKQFRRYILSLVPQAKMESMRFRSVAFSAPTNSLDEKSKPDDATFSTKEKRQITRADTWRKAGGEAKKDNVDKKKRDADISDNDQPQKSSHPTLTPAQRKRVAFYKQEFHKTADSANAYVVFAHTPEDAAKDSSILHPAQAARLLVEVGNGSIYMSRTLRMDRVGQWKAGLPSGEKDQMNLRGLVDPPCTLFVGNLDFAAKEEDLRTFFDTLLSEERGEPPEDQSSKIGGNDETMKKRSWVVTVRIIRDRDTQLGKGFAYVRFIDRECVDEILALESGTVKFAKRKLRLQRCKGLPGATPKSTPIVKTPKGKQPQSKLKTKTTPAKKPSKSQNSPIVIPKGDPELGAKLASLSKEDRKAAKAADSARLERRLAKKRAKLSHKRGSTGTEKLENKQRHRQRKYPAASKKTQSTGSRKGRLRSEKSLAKRNLKK